jgi:hypothetical protein
MSARNTAKHLGTGLLLMALAAGTLKADWTYGYSDDYSTNKAEFDSYRHSAFWSKDTVPLPDPYLYYVETERERGLAFADHEGQLAELGYEFPISSAQPVRTIKGTVEIDVTFPSVADIAQDPPGELYYSTSQDGTAWSAATALQEGHRYIPITSASGRCYILFTGTRVLIDNLRASLYSPDVTIRVPGSFRTIQAAIDAAGDGDVIEVAPGTYTGPGNYNIDFRGKAITVRSAAGPQSTIINLAGAAAGENRRGFYFHMGESPDTVLSGFTVRGGRVSGSEIPPNPFSWTRSATHPIGGGIYCEFSSPTIVDCVISDCGAELGGGIGCVGGEPVIVDCVIEQCTAGGFGAAQSGGRGGGVGLIAQANATLANCVIRDNVAYSNSFGAGLYCADSTATVAGSVITGNSAPGSIRGGGAYCTGSNTDVTFKNCIIAQNEADIGAGIYAEATSFAQGCRVGVINCTVAQNRLSGYPASSTGGGIHSVDADIHVVSSIVWYNGGRAAAISGAPAKDPVSYSNVQGGFAGPGNLNEEPLFASLSAPDYHVKSSEGRYDPASGGWRYDAVTSPCVDMGDPKASVAEEPAPHGDRINMGAYGGTPEASRGSEHVIYHVDGFSGRDWNDGRSRSRAFKTIQHAIDQALDGDTVLVWPGVYTEQITFMRKAITVQSAADAAVLTGPGGFGASFFFAESSRSVLANFVITGCGEGGIYCEGASPTLKNLTVTANRFGIMAYGGSYPNIRNCVLWGNSDGDLFDCEARFSCLQQSAADKNRGNIRTDPLFADPERGDYHLKSRYGRYEAQFDRWVTDTVTSSCIDAGDPEEYPRSEPMPNGARVNMGAYGGSPFASKSSWPALDSAGQFGVIFDIDAVFENETVSVVPQTQTAVASVRGE